MSRHHTNSPGQILLFPHGEALEQEAPAQQPKRSSAKKTEIPSVVVCGTYRKDPEGLKRVYEHLHDSGFSVLSPTNPFIENEADGFVYMRGETTQSPDEIEIKHLNAIQKADFIWFFAPDGYVGPTGALEVGYAHANGIPVFSDTLPNDTTIKSFIQIVDSPDSALSRITDYNLSKPPPPAVRRFQHYYYKAALQRGYSHESARDCLMLMVEEVGELARALRKRSKLTRHGSAITNDESLELADVFIYVVHLANILKVDLATVVQEKEIRNINKMANEHRLRNII